LSQVLVFRTLDVFAFCGDGCELGWLAGSGGDVVFWVDKRAGLKVAWKSFGVGRGEGLDEARCRFLSFELWMLLRLAKAAASGVSWRWWW
jgi:hypothetical protein